MKCTGYSSPSGKQRRLRRKLTNLKWKNSGKTQKSKFQNISLKLIIVMFCRRFYKIQYLPETTNFKQWSGVNPNSLAPSIFRYSCRFFSSIVSFFKQDFTFSTLGSFESFDIAFTLKIGRFFFYLI